YVEIGVDPLLTFDIVAQDVQPQADRTRIAQADDLLKELKALILQMVRSLSKYGTAATKTVNQRWAAFEARALEGRATAAQCRVSLGRDGKNQGAVPGDLLGKNRDTEVAPYVVLARHGGKLLRMALEVYKSEKNRLDDYGRDHLRDLFQSKVAGATF